MEPGTKENPWTLKTPPLTDYTMHKEIKDGMVLKRGLRGRFGMYIPPLMEKPGLADLTHDPKGNKMRAK